MSTRREAAAAGSAGTSETPGEDLAHVLALGDTLGELFLDTRAERCGVPDGRLLVLDPGGGVPALHGPDAAAADPEHLTVASRGVVAGEPRDQRGDVGRVEHVELARGHLAAHQRGGAR